MPKIEGSKSSRKTVKIDGLFMGSFLMPHEDRFWKRTCVIEGCTHKIGPSIQDIKDGWKPCSKEALPGFAAREVKGGGSSEFISVGIVCACHSAAILREDRPRGA